MVESNQGFAPLTTVYPVQERNTLSTITIGHIDECHLACVASVSVKQRAKNGLIAPFIAL